MRIILIAILLSATMSSVFYRSNFTKIQAKRLILYNSTSPVATNQNLSYVFTFYQNYQELPNIFYTVCNFNIANTRFIEYDVKLTDKSLTSASFSFLVGPQTSVYAFGIHIISCTFYGFSSGTVALQSIICANRVLSTVNCTQNFILPYRSTQFTFYALTAIYLDNDNTGTNGANTYYFYVSRQETTTSSTLAVTVGPTIKVYNFTYSYLIATYLTGNSNNVSLGFRNNRAFAHNSFITFNTLYADGQLMSNETGIIGLVGFRFDSNNYLNFDSLFPSQNVAKTHIPTTVTTSITPIIYLDLLVLGAAFCKTPNYTVIYPDADCWPCNPANCTSCQDNLCTSCVSPRYLVGADEINKAGLCLCGPGQTEIAQTCQNCSQPCSQCFGSATNCTSCEYGYKLIRGNCVKICYIISKKLQCQVCPQGCQVCSQSMTCLRTTCTIPLFYFNNTCLAICPNKTFGYNYTCKSCSADCQNCTAYESCSLCGSGTFLSFSGFCAQCHSSCLTCSGPSETNCTTCRQGLQTSGKCSVKTSFMIFPICSIGTFVSGDVCQSCPTNCSVCSSNMCLQCNKSYILLNGNCVLCESIPQFQYQNESCYEVCGDGLKIYAQCDDGNTVNGDGCSSDCRFEQGFACEKNSQIDRPDLCYNRSFIPWAHVYRNLLENKVKIVFGSEISNIESVLIQCWDPLKNNQSVKTLSNVQIMEIEIYPNKSSIVLEVKEDFQGHVCSIQLTTLLSISFQIQTIPQANLLPFPAVTINKIVSFLKIFMILTLIISMIFYYITPYSIGPFYCYICLYIIGHLNARGTPLLMYSIAPTFNWITITPEKDERYPYSLRRFLELYENLFQLSWPLFLLFALTILLIMVLRLVRKRLPKKLVLIIRTPISDPLRFLHCSSFAFEPILVTRMIFVITTNPQSMNILLLVFFFLGMVASFISLVLILRKSNRFVLACDGPVIRVLIYLYILLLTKYYKSTHSGIGSLIAIALTFCMMCCRAYLLIKTSLKKKKQDQLKSEMSDFNYSSKHHLKILLERIQLCLCFINSLFFLYDNILSFYLSTRTTDRSQIEFRFGIAKLVGFITFVSLNLTLIMWMGIAKIREVLKRKQVVYPIRNRQKARKQSTDSFASDISHSKININKFRNIENSIKIKKVLSRRDTLSTLNIN